MNNSENIYPQYLYHYTEFETILDILNTKKIRFNRLDKVDDSNEGSVILHKSNERIDIMQKLIYCSCWTGSDEENLLLWNTCAQNFGARIKMKSNMFAENICSKEREGGFVPVSDISSLMYKIDVIEGMEKVLLKEIEGPFEIIYEDDTSAILKSPYTTYRGIDAELNVEEDLSKVSLGKLGTKKGNYWANEKEWRYKISPFKAVCTLNEETLIEMDQNQQLITPEFIDIPYICEIEEIMISPYVSEQKYDSLLEWARNNGLNVPIKRSSIAIRQ